MSPGPGFNFRLQYFQPYCIHSILIFLRTPEGGTGTERKNGASFRLPFTVDVLPSPPTSKQQQQQQQQKDQVKAVGEVRYTRKRNNNTTMLNFAVPLSITLLLQLLGTQVSGYRNEFKVGMTRVEFS